MTSYSSNWFTLHAPVIHWFCVVIGSIVVQDRLKREPVDLVTEDYDDHFVSE